MHIAQETQTSVANGTAMAAYLAAGIGSFVMGLIVLLDSVGLFPFPALYEPSGGVTTRTTAAVLIWLAFWVLLHHRWKGRQIDGRRILSVMLGLIALGVLLTFPPFMQAI